MRTALTITLLLVTAPALFAQQPLITTAPEEPPPYWQVGSEYLLWWLRRASLPPMVTTGPQASAGVLGRDGTQVIYGNEGLETRHDDRFMGGRFTLEHYDPENFGFEGRAFFLERDSTNLTIGPTTDSLALSYVNSKTGAFASQVIAGRDPVRGPLTGAFNGYSRVELFGEELNFVAPLSSGATWKVDFLAGARFLQMRDRFRETGVSRNTNPAGGFDATAILDSVMDNIRVGNSYYGGQMGLRTELDWGRFFVQARLTGGVGVNAERYRAYGETLHQTPLVRQVTPVGLYVQQSNTGDYHRTHMDAVGEAGLNAGYHMTDRIDLSLGYSALLWMSPLRAAEQVNTVINTTQSKGGRPLPQVLFKGSPFWAQGMNVGVTFRF